MEEMPEEMKEFFDNMRKSAVGMRGNIIDYGSFYSIYVENPAAAMATFYIEVEKLHKAVLSAYAEDEDIFPQVKESMLFSLETITKRVEDTTSEQLINTVNEHIKDLKEHLPVILEILEKETKEKVPDFYR